MASESNMAFNGTSIPLNGIADKPRMLLTLFQEHNDHVAALVQVGRDFAPGTLERYKTAKEHTQSFLQWKYKIDDIDIRRLDFEFASVSL